MARSAAGRPGPARRRLPAAEKVREKARRLGFASFGSEPMTGFFRWTVAVKGVREGAHDQQIAGNGETLPKGRQQVCLRSRRLNRQILLFPFGTHVCVVRSRARDGNVEIKNMSR